MSEQIDYFIPFSNLLQKRVSSNRKTSDVSLADFTYRMVMCMLVGNSQPFLKDMFYENVHYLIDDCEIFHGMNRNQAFDSLRELGHLSVLFVNDPATNHIYNRICKIINQLIASYPAEVEPDDEFTFDV